MKCEPTADDDTVKVQIGGPLGGLAVLEVSTDLKDWKETGTSGSVPVVETGTDAAGPFGLYHGIAKLALPRVSRAETPRSFYRAKLK